MSLFSAFSDFFSGSTSAPIAVDMPTHTPIEYGAIEHTSSPEIETASTPGWHNNWGSSADFTSSFDSSNGFASSDSFSSFD